MMQNMIRSSLTEYQVIPRTFPTQPQSQSFAVDTDSSQFVKLSDRELSDSEQESPDSGTPELDQLMHTAEKQMDHDSFSLASASVTNTPLSKFAEETPSGHKPRLCPFRLSRLQVLWQSLQVLRLRCRPQLQLGHRPHSSSGSGCGSNSAASASLIAF